MDAAQIESLATQIVLLLCSTIVSLYSFTSFVRCCAAKRQEHLEISVDDITTEQSVSTRENQVLVVTRQSVNKFYTPKQKTLQKFILLACTIQVIVQGGVYGFVMYLPHPSLLNEEEIIKQGFYGILLKFWLPIMVPKMLTMLLTTCLYASAGTWFIRVFFATIQQKYEIRSERRSQLINSQDSSYWKVLARQINYRIACFVNKHALFLLILFTFTFVSVLLILTLCFQYNLLSSEPNRLVLIGVLNGFTALVTTLVTVIFIYGVAYHMDEIRFAYDTVVIVRRTKKAIPILIILASSYLVLFILWANHIYPFSCLRLHFPFQDVHERCSINKNKTQSENFQVLVTWETFLWYVSYVCLPVFIITTIFRKIPQNTRNNSLHLIPVSHSGNHGDNEENNYDRSPRNEQQRPRSLSSVLTGCFTGVKDKPKRFSIDNSALSGSPSSGPSKWIGIQSKKTKNVKTSTHSGGHVDGMP